MRFLNEQTDKNNNSLVYNLFYKLDYVIFFSNG